MGSWLVGSDLVCQNPYVAPCLQCICIRLSGRVMVALQCGESGVPIHQVHGRSYPHMPLGQEPVALCLHLLLSRV